MEGGGMCYVMKLSIVTAALCRPNENAIGASWVRYVGESGSPPVSYVMTLTKE